MDIRKVKKLIELLEESAISEIEIKEGEESVRISRANSAAAYVLPPPAPAAVPTPRPAAVASTAVAAATRPKPAVVPDSPLPTAVQAKSSDGDGKLSRDVLMKLPPDELRRARRLSLSLRLEDNERQVVHELQDVELDLQNRTDLQEMQVQLNIRLNPEG